MQYRQRLQLLSTIALLLFTIAIMMLPSALSAHDLRCQDWISGEDPKYDRNLDRVASKDEKGVKSVCKDFFPTWGERIQISRSSTDPFSAQYNIIRQYCSGRNIINSKWDSDRSTGESLCGMCRSQICWFGLIPYPCCIQNGWNPPEFTSWVETFRTSFSINEVAPTGRPDLATLKPLESGRSKLHNICLYRVKPGEDYDHGGSNKGNTNKVCAYVVGIFGCGNPIGFDWKNALIGCVDEPYIPGPKNYNDVVIGDVIAFVDESIPLSYYVDLGSTFDQPLLELTNGFAGGANKSLVLRYRFDGDDNPIDERSICQVFPDGKNRTYCAKVPTDDPSKVCACLKESCNDNIFLGCAPRPTLVDSNYTLAVKYQTHIDSLGNENPAIAVQFAYALPDGKAIYIDADGKEAYYDDDGSAYQVINGLPSTLPAKEPMLVKNLPLSEKPVVLREYYRVDDPKTGAYQVALDDLSIYGVSLSAVIPEFIEGTQVPHQVRVATPDRMKDLTGCYHFAAFDVNSSDDRWPLYYLRSGKRNNKHCTQCPSDQPNLCIIPPAIRCFEGMENASDADRQMIEHDEDAVRAFCPGYYEGAEDISALDKICVVNNTDFNFLESEELICVEVPATCAANPTPTTGSGYAIYPDEGEAGSEQIGRCSSAHGFESQVSYTVNYPDPLQETDEKAAAALRTTNNKVDDLFIKMQEGLLTRNINIPKAAMDALMKEADSRTTYSSQTINPSRTCGGAGSSGAINAKCSVITGEKCSAITEANAVFGYATFPETAGKLSAVGKCGEGYTSSAGTEGPSLQCKQIDLKIGAEQVFFSYWDIYSITDACRSDDE